MVSSFDTTFAAATRGSVGAVDTASSKCTVNAAFGVPSHERVCGAVVGTSTRRSAGTVVAVAFGAIPTEVLAGMVAANPVTDTTVSLAGGDVAGEVAVDESRLVAAAGCGMPSDKPDWRGQGMITRRCKPS